MKKTTVIILFLAASMAVSAQNASFGPTIGINDSWITGTNTANVSRTAKVGLNAGVTFTYSVDPHWALGADAKFSMEGVKLKYTSGSTIVEGNEKANYIRVPLKVIYFFGERGEKFRPKLFAGPSLGFFLGGKSKSTVNGIEYETDSKDYIKSFDIGLLIGTGFNYRIAKATWLNVDLGYTNGFLNTIKNNNGNPLLPTTAYNRNFSLNVGVAFPIGSIKPAKSSTRKRR